MSTAICIKCGKIRSWRAQRGARLSELRCECGGELRRATYTDGQWVQATQDRASAGKHYQTCEVCQRRTLRLLKALVDFRQRFDSSNRIFPAGTKVCSFHCQSMLPADHPYWALIDSPVTPALLNTWIEEIETWISAGRKPDDATPDDWEWQSGSPTWLRAELAKANGKQDLIVLRNSVIDHVLRARGLSISYQEHSARLFGPVQQG